MLLQLPLYVGLIFSRNLDLNIALSFFMGICCVGRYNGCYIVISEFVHLKYKDAVSTLLLMFECIVTMLIALYFKFISKDWVYL